MTTAALAGTLGFAALGALGSAHCLGMCGPLVTAYDDRVDAGPRYRRRQQAVFNLGRTAGYTLLGTLFGAAGALLYGAADLAAVGTAVRGVTGVVVGVLVALAGLNYLTSGHAAGHVVGVPLVGSAFRRVSGALADRIDALVDGPGIALLGAMHGLLPCPLLYPAFAYAFATGSPVRGALALAALGLGTVPLVFAYGTALASLSAATRRHLHRALGGVFVLLASVPLAAGLASFGVDIPHVPLPMP